ncbi:hypothetical protein MTR67_017929 [Solanum verrucosum]|uniref:Uncharacterized protein n=1 Tax=Solanum verrucosum TaxID=315347 RepID=A0AAF0QR92_SOLVR|nr:hypothetical protein MTR67_017929 [Solanum verrucosum]
MLYGYNFFYVTWVFIFPLLFLQNVIILAPSILHIICFFTQDRNMLLWTIILFVKRFPKVTLRFLMFPPHNNLLIFLRKVSLLQNSRSFGTIFMFVPPLQIEGG